MSQKTLFKILTNNGMQARFMNGLNDIKKCVELKSVHFKKKKRGRFADSCLTSHDVVEI